MISSFNPGGAESASMSLMKPHWYSRLASVSISVSAVGMTTRFYAVKLLPQPQLLVALGFLNTNPRPITSSLKSISVPLR